MPKGRPKKAADAATLPGVDAQTVDLLRESLSDLIRGSSDSYFKCHILARLGVEDVGQLDGRLDQLLKVKPEPGGEGQGHGQGQGQVEDWKVMEFENAAWRSDYDRLENADVKVAPEYGHGDAQEAWSSQQSIPGFQRHQETTNDFDLIARYDGLFPDLSPGFKQEMNFDF